MSDDATHGDRSTSRRGAERPAPQAQERAR